MITRNQIKVGDFVWEKVLGKVEVKELTDYSAWVLSKEKDSNSTTIKMYHINFENLSLTEI